MSRAQAQAAADAVAENARRVAEINERNAEPAPTPDMSRAVPTTVALRKAFAALPDEEKATVRQAVADSLVAGVKKGDAWKAALTPPQAAPVVSDAEALSSGADREALYQLAVERQKQGPRGKGRTISDEELAAYVSELRAQFPEASCRHEQHIAYWLEGIAIGSATPGSRWTRAWDAATERLAS